MKLPKVLCAVLLFSLAIFFEASSQTIGDERVLTFHLVQRDIDLGKVDLDTLVEAGRFLFLARFSILDGAGRPGSTGSGLPTRRPLVNAKPFLRTSGPDANSCASCHNRPEMGAAGDFVVNVFVGAQEREPVLLSVSPELSAERGTTSLNGSGLIELLAREMTKDLHRIREAAILQARRGNANVRLGLITKGVSFGYIRAFPDGGVSTTETEGIDKDLVVRPWSQKGVVTSLRTFTVTALNHHHGMQAVERFGLRRTGSLDFDRDGVIDELTEGDVTALTAFQATLPAPTVVLPLEPRRVAAVERGRRVFAEIGCAECHRLSLPLESTRYTEPGEYNLEGTLRASEVARPVEIDLAKLPWGNRLRRDNEGRVLVEAFTDLKRHRIADAEEPFFANEVVSQGFAPTDEFITKRLWDVGNTPPYGHRGDLTTLGEAIVRHGGEARGSRLRYVALDELDRVAVIEFLKTLQIVPLESTSEPAANRLSPRLEALASRWELEIRKSLTDQFVARAEAAAVRAERSRDHLRSLVLRIEHERRRIDTDKWRADESADWLPRETTLLSGQIRKQIQGATADTDTLQILNSIERTENALDDAYRLAERALELAAIANPGSPGTPIGHLNASAMLATIESLQSKGERLPVLQQLVAWCEDVTFRVEQLVQQGAVAELRVEAVAGQKLRNEKANYGTAK